MMISSLFMGCKIGIECEVVDSMPGFDDLVNVEGIQIENILFKQEEVIDDPNLLEIDLIIDSDSLYNKWKDASQDCEECEFPEIDFTTRTLIGKFYRIGCLDIPLLSITKEGNAYTYYTKLVNEHQCFIRTCDNYTFGWVSIPKIDSSATFEFKKGVSYKECDC